MGDSHWDKLAKGGGRRPSQRRPAEAPPLSSDSPEEVFGQSNQGQLPDPVDVAGAGLEGLADKIAEAVSEATTPGEVMDQIDSAVEEALPEPPSQLDQDRAEAQDQGISIGELRDNRAQAERDAFEAELEEDKEEAKRTGQTIHQVREARRQEDLLGSEDEEPEPQEPDGLEEPAAPEEPSEADDPVVAILSAIAADLAEIKDSLAEGGQSHG